MHGSYESEAIMAEPDVINLADPTNSLDRFRRRAHRHAVEDGAIDLVVGLFTLMVGVATQRRVFFAFAYLYLLSMIMFWKPLHLGLTSRRTGYAELPEAPPLPLLTAVMLAALLTMGVVAVFTLATGRLWNLQGWPAWAPVLAGLILAVGFLDTARKSGVVRFYVFAAASVAGSLFFWLFPFGARINPSDRLTLFLFALAGVQMAVGAVTMAAFVRRKPVVPDEASNVC
jgi:hypothetical protein